jgi:histone H3/H4
MQIVQEILVGFALLIGVIAVIALIAWSIWKHERRRSITVILKRHFRPTPLSRIVVTERQFPSQIRADLQFAIEEFLRDAKVSHFTGIQSEFGLGVDFTSLLSDKLMNPMSVSVGPPQYEQIDVGEDEPIRALKNGLWLLKRDVTKLAILYAPFSEMPGCAAARIRFQIASPDDPEAVKVSEAFLTHLETAVQNARCYRGKILSLEQGDDYSGRASGVQVHRLGSIVRDQVILPGKTLDLLDRNVVDFVKRREQLGECKMATKKGVLFYGPPGTGKTHTIRYLAGSLEGHTTLLISAEQVGLLGEYMTLARLLQPSMVVIEDVDLIARERTKMRDPRAELLLNKLLNEMDGLREDSQIVFVLTTNRPEELEAALASRPGRIDQAIEFPLPDGPGRRKLVRLYAHGIELSDDLVQSIVARTEKVSASFIKELMRRSAQCHFERDKSRTLTLPDVERALDEMLFSGGSLNLKLLGAEERIGDEPDDS